MSVVIVLCDVFVLYVFVLHFFFFFFSSRRRHTRWTGDWSSDVCSSDLALQLLSQRSNRPQGSSPPHVQPLPASLANIESSLRSQSGTSRTTQVPKIGRASCRERV